jgi:transposase
MSKKRGMKMRPKHISLTKEDRIFLEKELEKASKSKEVLRINALLLSEKYNVKELSDISRVSVRTVFNWFKEWETNKKIKMSSGGFRWSIIETKEEENFIKESIKNNPVRIVVSLFKEKFGKNMCEETLRRALKKTD